MSGKIEISRELLERIASGMWYADSRMSLADELDKILAAPVVERQVCYQHNGEPCQCITSPPAPVAVIDPYVVAESVRTALDRKACPNAWMVIAYEAVVDKVKELNQ